MCREGEIQNSKIASERKQPHNDWFKQYAYISFMLSTKVTKLIWQISWWLNQYTYHLHNKSDQEQNQQCQKTKDCKKKKLKTAKVQMKQSDYISHYNFSQTIMCIIIRSHQAKILHKWLGYETAIASQTIPWWLSQTKHYHQHEHISSRWISMILYNQDYPLDGALPAKIWLLHNFQFTSLSLRAATAKQCTSTLAKQ